MDGVTTIVKVAHVRLCHSRVMFVRAYPRETQEMGVRRARTRLCFLQGRLHARRLRQSMDVSRARRSVGAAAGMRESIRPVAGRFAPLALMGVRLLLAS